MKKWDEIVRGVRAGGAGLLRDAVKMSWDLFRVMVPVIVVVKVLKELGVVRYAGAALGPVMELVGLPGEMGLVWATAMLTNLYGGMAVFVEVAPTLSPAITTGQVTVLCTMMLVAHNLPVEVRIAQKAGTRFRFMLAFRFVGALVLGVMLNLVYRWGGFLGGANVTLWKPTPEDASWVGWALGQGKFLVVVFAIIVGLLLLMRFLKWAGVTGLLTWLLGPVLRGLGMTRAAAPVTIIGMTLGLAYGGGLIIQEVRSGGLTKRDVFFSLALMGLCHSVIEDTLLMMALGAHSSGVLWARVVFSLVVVFLLVRAVGRVSDGTFDRFCVRRTENQHR